METLQCHLINLAKILANELPWKVRTAEILKVLSEITEVNFACLWQFNFIDKQIKLLCASDNLTLEIKNFNLEGDVLLESFLPLSKLNFCSPKNSEFIVALSKELNCRHNFFSSFVSLGPESVKLLSLHSNFVQSPSLEKLNLLAPLERVLELALGKSENLLDENAQLVVKELYIEKSLRQIQSKIFAQITHNNILQVAVDTLGHMLKASACYVWRYDLENEIVSHEYVDPFLFPLGLGSKIFLPNKLAHFFLQKTRVIDDYLAFDSENNVCQSELEQFRETGVRSLIASPISLDSGKLGVLVVQNNYLRIWTKPEIFLLENVASSLSIALSKAKLYEEARVQAMNNSILAQLNEKLNKTIELILSKNNEQMSYGSAEASENIRIIQQTKIPLSSRELEVLALIASGLANKEIAQKLYLTESTVELHASRIRKKLKLKSRTALVKFACDNDLV